MMDGAGMNPASATAEAASISPDHAVLLSSMTLYAHEDGWDTPGKELTRRSNAMVFSDDSTIM